MVKVQFLAVLVLVLTGCATAPQIKNASDELISIQKVRQNEIPILEKGFGRIHITSEDDECISRGAFCGSVIAMVPEVTIHSDKHNDTRTLGLIGSSNQTVIDLLPGIYLLNCFHHEYRKAEPAQFLSFKDNNPTGKIMVNLQQNSVRTIIISRQLVVLGEGEGEERRYHCSSNSTGFTHRPVSVGSILMSAITFPLGGVFFYHPSQSNLSDTPSFRRAPLIEPKALTKKELKNRTYVRYINRLF